MHKSYSIMELFSGIGSQAKALGNLGVKVNSLGTCEWDIHAFIAYDAIHNGPVIPAEYYDMSKKEILEYLKDKTLSIDGKQAVNYATLKSYPVSILRRIKAAIDRTQNRMDVSSLTGDQMPENLDILTYSFPCQDLSNVGAFHGYNKGIDKDSGSRSSLLWQVGRILQEMKDIGKELPRFLLMENVPTLLSDRHKKNFDIWIDDLKKLGYTSVYYQLNARFYGIPQNRPRLLMISVLTDGDWALEGFIEQRKILTETEIVKAYQESGFYQEKKIGDLLRIDYSNDTLFKEACSCTPNDTPSRKKIWDENPQLVLADGKINPEYEFVRTITTKQDRHPNSGNLYFDSGIEGRGKFRYLTPRECFLFMGFTDKDYENVVANNPASRKNAVLFPRDKIIRMAGNSIPVKLLEGIFWQIILIDNLIDEYHGCS